MRIGSLFSGIGGLELGLEWAGVGHTVWQVERDPYCQRVLAKHWPNAARYDDVCTVGAHNLAPVDVICGGFPCQDISSSGNKVGLVGARSGLWSEYARVIRELRPRFVVVENVSDLLVRGFGSVLGTLADLGYDAEWSFVSACAVGAPFTRQRLFIMAYANTVGLSRGAEYHGAASHQIRQGGVDTDRLCHGLPAVGDRRRAPVDPPPKGKTWAAGEPHTPRVVDGIPSRMDVVRIAALGNAVVPQVAQVVGQRILEIDRTLTQERAA